MPKAAAAERRLRSINSDVDVTGLVMDVTAENIFELIRDASIIVDAADNFETRLIVNDAAVKEGIPFLYGACVGATVLPLPWCRVLLLACIACSMHFRLAEQHVTQLASSVRLFCR